MPHQPFRSQESRGETPAPGGCYALAGNARQADLEREPPTEQGDKRGKSPGGNIHSLPAISYPSRFSSFAVTRQEGTLACPLPLLRFHACSPAPSLPPLFSLLYAQAIWKQKVLGVRLLTSLEVTATATAAARWVSCPRSPGLAQVPGITRGETSAFSGQPAALRRTSQLSSRPLQ